jgi:hypothetical protein
MGIKARLGRRLYASVDERMTEICRLGEEATQSLLFDWGPERNPMYYAVLANYDDQIEALNHSIHLFRDRNRYSTIFARFLHGQRLQVIRGLITYLNLVPKDLLSPKMEEIRKKFSDPLIREILDIVDDQNCPLLLSEKTVTSLLQPMHIIAFQFHVAYMAESPTDTTEFVLQ